ncbi:DNA-processing protein DprA [Fictibacillus sp. Mic-4]|uniref:DNA-processing protein DprA n=1 Tax=Fictibacillus TaxID=1329200 RepID=UPI0003F5EA7F|nr:DNA-processing protein DprA [Fictibacillus gelatini]
MDIERLILLHHCRGVGWKTMQLFIRFDSTLQSIFLMGKEELMQYFRMREHHAEAFLQDVRKLSYHSIMKQYYIHEIEMITYFDTNYPPLLKNIYDPPWVLYMKGNKELLLSKKSLSVVGTRKPSNRGLAATRKLLPPLIEEGWTIVSGLAEGIDGYAHHLTLSLNGNTIAVLGSGLGHIYPKSNEPLAHTIAKRGLLLSEYPFHTRPQKWQFPLRNRIISGLAPGLLVIEAREKSGSLITADQALEQGREVFAVPGAMIDEHSMGTNRLIQQGAKLVLETKDIIDELISTI